MVLLLLYKKVTANKEYFISKYNLFIYYVDIS